MTSQPPPEPTAGPDSEESTEATSAEASEVLALYEQAVPESGRRRRWSPGVILFCAFYVVLLVWGTWLRAYRLDMPPFDYPEARQMWNTRMAEGFIHGASLFRSRGGWIELMIHPWIYARTDGLRQMFGVELWTWGRTWSVIFGSLTVALAPLALWWAPGAGVGRGRRARLALMFMAAMAFNPYHIFLSRLLTTEPVTLSLQMAASIFFWRFFRDNRRYGSLAAFFVLLVLSGWAKIPSLIWLPGYLLYLFFLPGLKWRWRLPIVALIGFGALAVFRLYGLNPFTIFSSFEHDYPFWAGQFMEWKGNVLWMKAYYGKTLMMVTVPGALFAVIGLLTAPWLFRLTAVVFLVLFYGLVNQNTYNFCHFIIPSMALAVWGFDYLWETATAWHRQQLAVDADAAPTVRRSALAWAQQAALVAILLVVFAVLQPLTPESAQSAEPRGAIGEAVEVVERIVPTDASLINDDVEGCFAYMLGRGTLPFDRAVNLNRAGAHHLTFNRYAVDQSMINGSKNWVRSASIPGEFGYILYSQSPQSITRLRGDDFVSMRLPVDPNERFGLSEAVLPVAHVDRENRRIVVRPGEELKIGLRWQNADQHLLIFMTWTHDRIEEQVPPPVREGGVAVYSGANLCLNGKRNADGVYAFAIPAGFPTGDYTIHFYPFSDLTLKTKVEKLHRFPLQLRVEPVADERADASLPLERGFVDLYPQVFDRPPGLWSDDRSYGAMKVEGYTLNRDSTWIWSTPRRPAGDYKLVVRGSAYPTTEPDAPDMLWPSIKVFACGNEKQEVGTISVNSQTIREFELPIHADQPFDNLLLAVDIAGTRDGHIPPLLTEFIPRNYGLRLAQQYAQLRGVKLIPVAAPAPAAE